MQFIGDLAHATSLPINLIFNFIFFCIIKPPYKNT
nr:MAG TPA_asm: hypothetical protein [Caudoviricetes sp.]